jgi:hypothetical protein
MTSEELGNISNKSTDELLLDRPQFLFRRGFVHGGTIRIYQRTVMPLNAKSRRTIRLKILNP